MSTDPIIAEMLKLEQGLHRKGWDQPPGLYAVLRTGDHLRLQEMPVPWDGDPGAILEAIAARMTEATEGGLLLAGAISQLKGFHGLLFAYEAWSNTLSPGERDDRRLADIPGSREMRGVFVVTTDARLVYLARIRGEKPQIEAFATLGGRTPEALTRMVQVVAGLMPEDQVDLKALHDLEFPTDEDRC